MEIRCANTDKQRVSNHGIVSPTVTIIKQVMVNGGFRLRSRRNGYVRPIAGQDIVAKDHVFVVQRVDSEPIAVVVRSVVDEIHIAFGAIRLPSPLHDGKAIETVVVGDVVVDPDVFGQARPFG